MASEAATLGERPARTRIGLALCAVSLLSGLVTAWAFPPVDRPWLVFIGPVGLFWALSHATRLRQAALLGWCFGAPFFLLTLEFVRFGLGFIPWAPLALAEALFPMAGCMLGWLAARNARAVWRPALLACGWLIGDWFRWHGWAIRISLVDLGYALHSMPQLMQAADLGGVGLLTWMLALWSASVAVWLASRGEERRGAGRALLVAVALWGLSACYGAVWLARPEGGTPRAVAVVQPARRLPAFYEKSLPAPAWEEAEVYRSLVTEAGADGAELICLPESAFSANLASAPWAAEVLDPLIELGGAWVIAGFPEDIAPGPAATASEVLHYNTVAIFSPEAALAARYRKRQLVGFGEYLPFREQLASVYRHFPIRPYDVTPGSGPVLFDAGGIRLSPVICFESLYSGVVRESLQEGGEAVAIFTNDGWYQNEQEAKLHGRCAQFRAVENRVNVLNAATTADSGLVDSRGRWVARIPMDVPGAVLVHPSLQPPRSLYYLLGDAAALIPASLGLLLGQVSSLRGRRRERPRPTPLPPGD